MTHTSNGFSMKLGNRQFNGSDTKKDAGKMILQAVNSGKYAEQEIGTYRGFKIVPQKISGLTLVDMANIKVALIGSEKHVIELGESDLGVITRLDNALNSLEEKQNDITLSLTKTKDKLEATKAVIDTPFEYSTQLAEAQSELTAVNAELDIGKESHAHMVDEKAKGHEAVVSGVEVYEGDVEDEWEDEIA